MCYELYFTNLYHHILVGIICPFVLTKVFLGVCGEKEEGGIFSFCLYV